MTSFNTTNAPEMVTLKPCPFCGPLGLHMRPYQQFNDERGERWQWRIICPTCTTAGPCKPTEADAITAWNTRAPVHQSASPSGLVEAAHKKALDLALRMLIVFEPGDSRAVSDEFVAMSCILENDTRPEVLAIIDKALAKDAALTAAPATAGEGERFTADSPLGLAERTALPDTPENREHFAHAIGPGASEPSSDGEADATATRPTPSASGEAMNDAVRELLARVANGGPHEWGYRDITDGTFISDDWPFEAANLLAALSAQPAPVEGVGHKFLHLWREGENFVAYDTPNPKFEDGDPMVLGEPVAHAIYWPLAALHPNTESGRTPVEHDRESRP